MPLILRGLLILSLIAAAAYGMATWLNQLSDRTAAPASVHQPDDIDYQMKGFKAIIFNADGVATQRIRGEQLKHFPFDNRYEIEQPRGETLQSDNQWHIQSDLVATQNGLSELHWRDNVLITQKSEPATTMQTHYLVQRPNQHHVTTRSDVQLSSTAGTITAQAMQLDTLNNQLTLEGRVNGIYQTP